MGPSWEHLGASWGRLVASWRRLGASWVVLGASCGVLGRLGRVLGASCGVLVASWGILGASCGVLGRLGRAFGRLGSVWYVLGASCGRFSASCGFRGVWGAMVSKLLSQRLPSLFQDSAQRSPVVPPTPAARRPSETPSRARVSREAAQLALRAPRWYKTNPRCSQDVSKVATAAYA